MGYKKIAKEPNVIVALTILCQDYILFDDEFANNKKISKKMNDEEFWLELSKHLYGSVKELLENGKEDDGEYDEFEDSGVSDNEILAYVLNTENRFDLNDMIVNTVEHWLKFRGKR